MVQYDCYWHYKYDDYNNVSSTPRDFFFFRKN